MQKVTKRNIALAIIFLLILVVVALLIGNFTFSYLGADVSDDVTTQGETTASGDTIIFSKDNDLNLQATTDNFNATSGNLTDTVNPSARLIASSKTNEATATYYAGVRINNNTFTYSSGTTADVILTVRDETGAIVTTSDDSNLTYVTVTDKSGAQISGFDITGKTGAFNIAIKHPISTTSSTTGTTHTWTFTITFVNYTYDQSVNENATLDMEVILQKDEIMPTLASYIMNEVYTGVDGENGLYYHDGKGDYVNANLEAGDNSYRFAGANPNNYVCFGSTESLCPEENLYRIIGAFDDDKDSNYQIKLIKADYTTSAMLGTDGRDYYGNYSVSTSYYKGDMDTSTIAAYRWNYDTSVSNYGSNNWITSEFNNINLNANYINYLNGENSTTWSDLIADTTWYLGGLTSAKNTAKEFYEGERNNAGYQSNPTEDTAKIGLMYPSDYGYAASPENWTTDLLSYNSENNNWMYMGLIEWTITPYSSSSSNVFYVFYNGNLSNRNASNGYSARPVFYLKSSVELSGGIGTSSDPYRLAV